MKSKQSPMGPSLSAQEDHCIYSYAHITISREKHKPFHDKIVATCKSGVNIRLIFYLHRVTFVDQNYNV